MSPGRRTALLTRRKLLPSRPQAAERQRGASHRPGPDQVRPLPGNPPGIPERRRRSPPDEPG